MRDNHDRTKKKGQVANLEEKAKLQKSKHKDKKVISIVYFIDPNERKNGNYYKEELQKHVNKGYFDGAFVYYGDEIFEAFGINEAWEETKQMIIEHNQEAKSNNYIRNIIFQYIEKEKNVDYKKILSELFKKEED